MRVRSPVCIVWKIYRCCPTVPNDDNNIDCMNVSLVLRQDISSGAQYRDYHWTLKSHLWKLMFFTPG